MRCERVGVKVMGDVGEGSGCGKDGEGMGEGIVEEVGEGVG